jgi:solute carrier family 25 phosphate transporter 3
VGGVPIDVLKTRLQTDPGRYDGLWDAAWKVTRTEGAGMLLQGLGPTAAGYAVQGARAPVDLPHPNTRAPRACAETRRGAPAGGLKYGLYELFKVWLAGDTTALALPLPLLLLAAACAELVASTALCPYEAARIRLVADPSFAVGLLATLRRLVSEQGVYGVFGALPAMYLKMVPYTMAQLATYDGVTRALAAHLQGSGAAAASSSGSSSTDTLVRSSPAVQAGDLATFGIALVGAAAAALVASLASQPGDTLLSKLNQGRRALMPRTSVATQSGTPGGGGGLAMKSLAVRKQRDGGLIGGGATSSAIALGTATGAGSLVTSSDDESGVNGDDPPAQLGGMGGVGGEGGSTARASPSGAGGVDGAAQLGASRPHSSFGCGPMCALAARLGPAGLMLGWEARLMHTGASPGLVPGCWRILVPAPVSDAADADVAGTIVLFQLLVYDAVKAAVGLPVSAHGATAERRLL